MKAKPRIQNSLLNGFMIEVPVLQIPRKNVFLANISKIIDFEKFRHTLDDCYESIGRCAYDPVILLKMLLLQRWYNLSDRAVVAEAADRISFRLFLGLDISPTGLGTSNHPTIQHWSNSVIALTKTAFTLSL